MPPVDPLAVFGSGRGAFGSLQDDVPDVEVLDVEMIVVQAVSSTQARWCAILHTVGLSEWVQGGLMVKGAIQADRRDGRWAKHNCFACCLCRRGLWTMAVRWLLTAP